MPYTVVVTKPLHEKAKPPLVICMYGFHIRQSVREGRSETLASRFIRCEYNIQTLQQTKHATVVDSLLESTDDDTAKHEEQTSTCQDKRRLESLNDAQTAHLLNKTQTMHGFSPLAKLAESRYSLHNLVNIQNLWTSARTQIRMTHKSDTLYISTWPNYAKRRNKAPGL